MGQKREGWRWLIEEGESDALPSRAAGDSQPGTMFSSDRAVPALPVVRSAATPLCLLSSPSFPHPVPSCLLSLLHTQLTSFFLSFWYVYQSIP